VNFLNSYWKGTRKIKEELRFLPVVGDWVPTPTLPLDNTYGVHCIENQVYVFPEMKLRGLVHNSYIHLSVRDLHFHRIGCLLGAYLAAAK
jgi:hypothetical protein